MYIWKRKHKTLVTDFVPLLTNDVFGLSNNSALLLTYSKVTKITIVKLTFYLKKLYGFFYIIFAFFCLGKIINFTE